MICSKKKILLLISVLFLYLNGIYNVTALEETKDAKQDKKEICDPTILKEIRTLDGRALFDFAETIAYQSFKSYESLFNDHSELSITDIYPVKESGEKTFTNEDIDEWLNLYECIASYLYSVNDYSQRINYAQKFIILKEIIKKLPVYAKNIEAKKRVAVIRENLDTAIATVTDIFLIALNLIPSRSFSKRASIADIIKNYKNDTGIVFNPQAFFTAYAKLKNYYEAEGKPLSPSAIFNFLYGTNIITNSIDSGSGIYRQQQHAVAQFIYMLEQLIDASQNKKNSRWSIKKEFLTPEQIKFSKEIIKALYTLFPGVDLFTASLDDAGKPALLLLAQSRMVLIVLQSFRRAIR